ncbi:DUF3108 domain-containing protein [Roseateles violae]|uniref:DUF3108 domain-containing protein n=1 Tax=Roseateles violae TaxID=3058042 RepID=A0ABT8DVS0_9BURK|nr:DUF3108 domain-containing protein [Pelomonas sp. PFR6]MDN3920989.1 DUF3108 domain-containing protein [Pelomonas sp. PFR6]
MAGRLSPVRRPAGALALLALPVLLVHGWLAETVQRQMQLAEDASSTTPPPPRLQVAYLREMRPSAPSAPAKPRPQPRSRPEPAAPPARPASAPESVQAQAEAEPAAASEPELTAAVAASAPAAEPPLAAAEAAAGAAAAASEEAGEPGPEWPLSTKLNYRLTGNYRGPVHGDAQVEWARQGRHYQVHLEVAIGPSLAPLITRRMSSDGLLGPQGIAPRRYDEDTRVLFAARRQASVLFQGEQLTLANGRVEPAPAGAQDAASQFVQLTWLFLTGREPLRAGHVVELPLVLPKRQYRWRYEVLGEQQLDTPLGPLATWHLKPTRAAYGGDLSAEVWLAPSLQYLPVRLLIRQGEESHVDLVLSRPPLQESIVPPSAKETSP